ncbi:hypothetical protein [Francisella sp. 19X1-34]|uniref:hypothetical protein n=1 Tax=Francisella sp. 19X1-34 TaxID=3087177 RepID=UPI002E30FCEC|nr:hypothetical protein [Francisella sp. 19X1-34]MED7789262.1 hypothetical protein [Francisella sp. 19X1-34]
MNQQLYIEKLTTPKLAIESIDNGAKIFIAMASGQPPALIEELGKVIQNETLVEAKIYYKLSMAPIGEHLLKKEVAERCHLNTFFMTKYDRDAIKNGINDKKVSLRYIPYHFSELPSVATEDIKIDTIIVAVSPMDKHGYFSFALNNDLTSTVARKCKKVIVEVNPNLPRVHGESNIHISEVDIVVENKAPLLLVPRGKITEKQRVIGHKVASLIEDNSTIQLGIGGISDAVCEGLEHHKCLGIHTELLSPALMDLVKKGVATGTKKLYIKEKLYLL